MKNSFLFLISTLFVSLQLSTSCNNGTSGDGSDSDSTANQLHEENITYALDSVTMNGYVVYKGTGTEKRPAVLVVHEWWGLNPYAKTRARQLAELGYIAMAVDMYGNGREADNPDSAMKLAGPFYEDPQMGYARFEAAKSKLMSYEQTDTSRMAAIGYCFGGAMVINAAKLGSNLDGVVSFHGNLMVVPANKDLLKANILICHGADDPLVPQSEVDQFKKQMDDIGAKYSFRSYEGAMHAFTNPNSTERGKQFNMPIAYNAHADQESWEHMKDFLQDIFK